MPNETATRAPVNGFPKQLITIVIPFYNEETCVDHVCEELLRVMTEEATQVPPWEAVLVDDQVLGGSLDANRELGSLPPERGFGPSGTAQQGGIGVGGFVSLSQGCTGAGKGLAARPEAEKVGWGGAGTCRQQQRCQHPKSRPPSESHRPRP